MTKILVALVVIGILSIAFTIVLWNVVSHAVNNAFDWLILTFGNEEAARRLREERGWVD